MQTYTTAPHAIASCMVGRPCGPCMLVPAASCVLGVDMFGVTSGDADDG